MGTPFFTQLLSSLNNYRAHTEYNEADDDANENENDWTLPVEKLEWVLTRFCALERGQVAWQLFAS